MGIRLVRVGSVALAVVSEILMLAGILGVLLAVIVLLELAEAKTTVNEADRESSVVG